MAKYTLDDLKNLKKAEIVDLLKSEGIEFDPSQTAVALRNLLLDAEEDAAPTEAVAAPAEAELDLSGLAPAEDAAKEEPQAEVAPLEKPEIEDAKAVKAAAEEKAIKAAADRAFEAELAKRMGRFGKVRATSFDLELARRRGKNTKATFEEELRARRLRFNKK